MTATPFTRRTAALLSVPLAAVALAACGSTVSTSSFKGEQKAAAQTVANLQADATANEPGKICTQDLAAGVVAKLGGKRGCEQAIKSQLAEIDNLEVSVQSVKIGPGAATATASAKSTYEGKSRAATISLVREGAAWKIVSTG